MALLINLAQYPDDGPLVYYSYQKYSSPQHTHTHTCDRNLNDLELRKEKKNKQKTDFGGGWPPKAPGPRRETGL